MTESAPPEMGFHQDPDFFREAVSFTAAETTFLPRIIEKDYFATILLHYISRSCDEIVFKGGTCLAKVHFEFYRMSEDLDFSIPTLLDSTRAQRRRSVERVKQVINDIHDQLDFMVVVSPMIGANNSRQYSAVIQYQSLMTSEMEMLKVEVGLREPLLAPSVEGQARTQLLNPVSRRSLVQSVNVRCLSILEASAEKIRAALTRREVAIRDFYDIQYAIDHNHLDPGNTHLLNLVQGKLSIPGNDPVDTSEGRLQDLELQLNAQLQPVLRSRDFADFELERAFNTVRQIASVMS